MSTAIQSFHWEQGFGQSMAVQIKKMKLMKQKFSSSKNYNLKNTAISFKQSWIQKKSNSNNCNSKIKLISYF